MDECKYMQQALIEIVDICEDTPEGSASIILDDALNEIMEIAEEFYIIEI